MPGNDSNTSRVLGCILGGALGDAFGYAIEFDRWDAICRQYGLRGLREPVLQRGQLVQSVPRLRASPLHARARNTVTKECLSVDAGRKLSSNLDRRRQPIACTS